VCISAYFMSSETSMRIEGSYFSSEESGMTATLTSNDPPLASKNQADPMPGKIIINNDPNNFVVGILMPPIAIATANFKVFTFQFKKQVGSAGNSFNLTI